MPTIHHNTSINGAGVKVGGSLTMASTNLISENTASVAGGGVYAECLATLIGVNPGTNVKDNTGDNLYVPTCSSGAHSGRPARAPDLLRRPTRAPPTTYHERPMVVIGGPS